jgi:hypothetical protein
MSKLVFIVHAQYFTKWYKLGPYKDLVDAIRVQEEWRQQYGQLTAYWGTDQITSTAEIEVPQSLQIQDQTLHSQVEDCTRNLQLMDVSYD